MLAHRNCARITTTTLPQPLRLQQPQLEPPHYHNHCDYNNHNWRATATTKVCTTHVCTTLRASAALAVCCAAPMLYVCADSAPSTTDNMLLPRAWLSTCLSTQESQLRMHHNRCDYNNHNWSHHTTTTTATTTTTTGEPQLPPKFAPHMFAPPCALLPPSLSVALRPCFMFAPIPHPALLTTCCFHALG